MHRNTKDTERDASTVKHGRIRKSNRLFLAVRRKLAFVTTAYLAGIYLAKTAVLSAAYTGILCALLLLRTFVCLRQRKSVLPYLVCIAALIGNLYAGAEIQRRDLPTGYGVQIEGRVSAIEKSYRVYLSDIVIDGSSKTHRPVLVSLLLDDEDTSVPSVQVGHHISGTGRLFVQDEKRNPGGVDRRIQAICDGYELSGYILPGWSVDGNPVFSLREMMRQCRDAVNEHVQRIFGEDAPFFQGIMLGSKNALDGELMTSMRLTGTIHILTVSGLHLSIIAVLLRKLMKRLPISRKVSALSVSLILMLFTGMTGAAPGTIRACIMALLKERAILRGRRYEPLTALAFSALMMTIVRPLWVFDASFQFSFIVVLGIILLSKGFAQTMQHDAMLAGMPNVLTNAVSISFCAQIAALPMQMMLYGYVPLLALPMNIVSSFLIPWLMVGGWVCAFSELMYMPIARWGAVGLALLANIFERISTAAAAVPGCIVRLPAPFEMTVFLSMMLMIFVSRSICFGKSRKTAAVLTLGLLAMSYLPRFDLDPQYVQLDVGQGDAAVIRNGRHAVLSDIGSANSYDVIRYLRHEGLFVDAVILSHLDEDHAGSLGAMLKTEIDIPAIIMAEGAVECASDDDVINALNVALKRGIPVHTLQRGDSMSVNGIHMDVLSPSYAISGSNERSLLIHAKLNDVSVLLTGDLPQSSEPVIVPECDILKVAHHGSKYATSEAFVNMAQPDIALISVGASNSYGHPSNRVIELLNASGAKVMRTDQMGAITIRMSKNNLEAFGYLNGR